MVHDVSGLQTALVAAFHSTAVWQQCSCSANWKF